MPNDVANNMVETIRFLEEENTSLTNSICDLQLAYNEQMVDLRKAKRLLGEAMRALNDASCNKDCRQCKWNNGGCEMGSRFAWKYGDEAMELLNKEGDTE